MTASPVVGPDRYGGPAVKAIVDHKVGIDARVCIDTAARQIVGALANKTDSKLPSIMISWSRELPLLKRASPLLMPTAAHATSRPALRCHLIFFETRG